MIEVGAGTDGDVKRRRGKLVQCGLSRGNTHAPVSLQAANQPCKIVVFAAARFNSDHEIVS